jgi:hypothetical protein
MQRPCAPGHLAQVRALGQREQLPGRFAGVCTRAGELLEVAAVAVAGEPCRAR